MANREIRYLIKFVSKLQYAEDLINGKLYMRPASYYHHLELGQGDIREAALSGELAIYKNSTIPIYCLYSVLQEEIINGAICVSKRVIHDFGCEHGYAVILDYQKFEPLLSHVKTNGYQLDAGLVNYHRITHADFGTLFTDKTLLNLFVKHPYFSYQREFRIVIAKQVYRYNEPPIDHTEYWFEGDLKSLSRIVDISMIPVIDDSYLLRL